MTSVKKKILYGLCFLLPHIMLVVGLYMLLKNREPLDRQLAITFCKFSAITLVVGSVIYYMIFTPFLELY